MDQKTVNLNELEKLGRLLATENIVIEHANVPTAAFDVENRVLSLPMWKDLTKPLYHMLVLHEVAHALWTTPEEWKKEILKNKKIKMFLNIVEDARIEKLMKEKFPGARPDFREGYQILNDRDFFGLQRRNLPIDKYPLADRINLHYKIGHLTPIPFADDEKRFLTKIDRARTFEDVVKIARELMERAQQQDAASEQQGEGEGQSQKQSGKNKNSGKPQQGEGGESDELEAGQEGEAGGNGEQEKNQSGKKGKNQNFVDIDTDDDEEGDEADGEGEGQGEPTEKDFDEFDQERPEQTGNSVGKQIGNDLGGVAAKNSLSAPAPAPKQMDIQTLENMEQSIKDMVDKTATPFSYINLDHDFPWQKIVIPYNDILEYCLKAAPEIQNTSRVTELAKRNNTIINYLIKEFEMKKQAERNVKSREAKTGLLNNARLHSYRTSDDIFRRSTVVPDGKNHGLVMFVDFSGSMQQNMSQTIEELYNLVAFCRKLRIPHRVYGFTNHQHNWYNNPKKNYMHPRQLYVLNQQRARGKKNWITVNSDMSLIELFHEKMHGSDFRRMAEALLYSFDGRHNYLGPFHLNSTPLDGSIVAAHTLCKAFQEETKTQIVSAIFLSDGDSSGAEIHNNTGSFGGYTRHANERTYLRRKTVNIRGNTYNSDMTSLLLKSLGQLGFHVIGYRVGQQQELNQTINYYLGDATEKSKIKKSISDRGCATIDHEFRGYQQQHFIRMNPTRYNYQTGLVEKDEPEEIEIDIKPGDTKRKMAKEFIKAQETKINTRSVLSNFAKKIARSSY